MRTLCTVAGRHGDALWSLATVRAIAETLGEQVDFCISGKYAGLVPLIRKQEYIREAYGEEEWEVLETAPMTPAEPPLIRGGSYDRIIHLSLRAWPSAPTLAESYWAVAKEQVNGLKALEVERPWIAPAYRPAYNPDLVVGFSDEWFELKVGLWDLVNTALYGGIQALCAHGSRWETETDGTACGWIEMSKQISSAKLFFGCLSAPWVLANALGKKTVIVEPNPNRLNPVFWLESPRNKMVMGGDLKPTFDARATVQMIKQVLGEGE
jgi:hypothetical protein